jgi:acyl-ACP thioesterase
VPIALRIERPYRVRFDEAGADGHLRSSGFLRYAQDLAWIHSESAGFGRDWYGARGLTWLARSVDLEILDDVAYGAVVNVSTEVIGFRRVWARRRSEFRPEGTERVLAVAITDWVLLNARGMPVRPPDEIVEVFPTDTTDYTPLRLDLPAPAGDATHFDFRARRSELDPLGHVNNAVYVDYVDEHLAAIDRRGWLRRRPRRYLVEFLASAEPDMELVGEGWDAEDAWCYRIRNGEKELFRARFESDPGRWVGG